MSCLRPLIAWRYKTDSFWFDKKVHIVAEKDLSEYGKNAYLRHERISVAPTEVEWLELPCGKCLQCRLQYSRNWADRCMLEAQQYENNAFITLTYNDDNLPTGGTLVPYHLTQFMKKLRQVFSRGYYKVNGKLYEFQPQTDIRFFGCGEYGSSDSYVDHKGNLRVGTERPHYHIILFNCNIPDKKFFFKNSQGDIVYLSDLLSAIWQYGNVSVGDVTWNSCAYVARYVVKKRTGSEAAAYYLSKNKLPEFVRMSRRPGIARKYFDENGKKIYEYDAIWLKKGDKLEKIKPARYFDKLYELEYEEHFAKIKQARKEKGESVDRVVQKASGLSKLERFRQADYITNEIVTKQLNRNYQKDTTI